MTDAASLKVQIRMAIEEMARAKGMIQVGTTMLNDSLGSVTALGIQASNHPAPYYAMNFIEHSVNEAEKIARLIENAMSNLQSWHDVI